MRGITTHVLDAVIGRPATGIAVKLEKRGDSAWVVIGESVTDADGRCRDLAEDAVSGVYRLTFNTGAYLTEKNRTSIYPEIVITFTSSGDTHYHLPLLLSDNSYTTYRGS